MRRSNVERLGAGGDVAGALGAWVAASAGAVRAQLGAWVAKAALAGAAGSRAISTAASADARARL